MSVFSHDCECVVRLRHLSILQIMIEFCPGGAVDATMLGRLLSLFPVFPHLPTFRHKGLIRYQLLCFFHG